MLEIDNEKANKPFEKIGIFNFCVSENNKFYKVEVLGTYNFNECLIKNNLTPQFLKDIKEGKKSIDEFEKLSYKDWGTNNVAKILEKEYAFVIEINQENGGVDKIIVEHSEGSSSIYTHEVGDGYFFKPDEAKTYS